jgi:O-antigen/teichoic acid export membrane protein
LLERTSLKDSVFTDKNLDDLKRQSVRGGVAVVSVQAMKLLLQIGSQIVLARLLSPADFGLMAMAAAVIGFLGLFRDAGLSIATVQSEVITHDQTSTLFWINAGIGVFLAAMAAVLSPVLVVFYHEPRILWVTIISATAFIFNGIAAQHQALLVRKRRFTIMALIDLLAQASAIAVGLTMALLGYGYWSLIGMTISGPAIAALALWLKVPWIPGKPVRKCGVRSMLNLGGTATCENAILYFGFNTEKILLGRFWGATLLGLYGRAYQLINLPMQYMSSSIFNVLFSALSRLQSDGERVCRFFLKSYSVLLSICIPITLSSLLFADDIIPVLLGPKWTEAIPILRLLAPTIVAFSLIQPFGWFMLSTGRALRSLKISFLITPVLILGILTGIHYGPKGVACGYSAAMLILVFPVISWAKKDYPITFTDIWLAIRGPIISGLAALLAGVCFLKFSDGILTRLPQLILGMLTVHSLYLSLLLFGMGQWHFYFDLIKQVTRPSSPQ